MKAPRNAVAALVVAVSLAACSTPKPKPPSLYSKWSETLDQQLRTKQADCAPTNIVTATCIADLDAVAATLDRIRADAEAVRGSDDGFDGLITALNRARETHDKIAHLNCDFHFSFDCVFRLADFDSDAANVAKEMSKLQTAGVA